MSDITDILSGTDADVAVLSKIMFVLNMSYLYFITLVFLIVPLYSQRIQQPLDDAHLTMEQRMAKHGYPLEVHYVTTKDGYILKMYRVPYGRFCGPEIPKKTPVIIMHGLMSSANDWMAASTDNALGFILPDECFDTWLSNSRGTFESINHTRLNTASKEFWDFSWHEMGVYDVPAMIHYVLDETKEDQVHIIAHSQGATQVFVYAAMNPEDSFDHIKSFHAFAPVSYMKVANPLFKFAAQFVTYLKDIVDFVGIYQLPPRSWLTEELQRTLCLNEGNELDQLCNDFFYIMFGYDNKEMNTTLFPTFIAIEPAGAAVKQLAHYAQEMNSGQFRPYDYGPQKNTELYGLPEPPNYRVDKIKFPTYLHYSDTDLMAGKPDVEHLHRLITTSKMIKVPIVFNHFDYIYGNNVRQVVYDEMIRLLHEAEDLDESEDDEDDTEGLMDGNKGGEVFN